MRIGQAGFTLIELMIVLLVAAILTAIAVPSYRAYVVRSQRVDAKEALLALGTAQEKFFLQCNRYAGALGAVNSCADPGTVAFPETSKKGWYQLTVEEASVTDFRIRAEPVAGGAQASDSTCTFFEVTGAGVKSASDTKCW